MGKIGIILQFLCSVLWALIAKDYGQKGEKTALIVMAYINCALHFAVGVLLLITPEETPELEEE